jgi:hypothetical protein
MKRRIERAEEAVRRAAGEDAEGRRIKIRVIRKVCASLDPEVVLSSSERVIFPGGNYEAAT